MSALVCSISRTPIIEGVVSKNGHVYQRSIIEKYIEIYGVCPHTNESLTKNDLITIARVPPLIAFNHSSIPSMIEKLSNEFDRAILETHLNREQLKRVREELAMALYQEDAALRVIARLNEEQVKSKERMTQLSNQVKIAMNQ